MRRDSWETIRDCLAEDIKSGKMAVGTRLPTEPELCATFEVGRHSVRRAVAALAGAGKLRVEQGRGTFVEAAPLITYRIGHRTRFRENLLQHGLSSKRENVSATILPAPENVATALNIPKGTAVHQTLRRGFADATPLYLSLSFHSVSAFPDLAEKRANGMSITDIYRDHDIADYFRKSTTIFTRLPEPEEARLLHQHKHLPVLVVTKTDVTPEGKAIGYSESVWVGNRVQFSFEGFDDCDHPTGHGQTQKENR
jgi:GntR family transcriptional regulator, phosphonate transport system regulatory protein